MYPYSLLSTKKKGKGGKKEKKKHFLDIKCVAQIMCIIFKKKKEHNPGVWVKSNLLKLNLQVQVFHIPPFRSDFL